MKKTSMFGMSYLWITFLLSVGGLVDGQVMPPTLLCPRYVNFFCRCDATENSQIMPVRMCLYRSDYEGVACHPCPNYMQDYISCSFCSNDACPVCSPDEFNMREIYGYSPIVAPQQMFFTFSEDKDGIYYMSPREVSKVFSTRNSKDGYNGADFKDNMNSDVMSNRDNKNSSKVVLKKDRKRVNATLNQKHDYPNGDYQYVKGGTQSIKRHKISRRMVSKVNTTNSIYDIDEYGHHLVKNHGGKIMKYNHGKSKKHAHVIPISNRTLNGSNSTNKTISAKGAVSLNDETSINATSSGRRVHSLKDTGSVNNAISMNDTGSVSDTGTMKNTGSKNYKRSLKDSISVNDTSFANKKPSVKDTFSRKDRDFVNDTRFINDSNSVNNTDYAFFRFKEIHDTSSANKPMRLTLGNRDRTFVNDTSSVYNTSSYDFDKERNKTKRHAYSIKLFIVESENERNSQDSKKETNKIIVYKGDISKEKKHKSHKQSNNVLDQPDNNRYNTKIYDFLKDIKLFDGSIKQLKDKCFVRKVNTNSNKGLQNKSLAASHDFQCIIFEKGIKSPSSATSTSSSMHTSDFRDIKMTLNNEELFSAVGDILKCLLDKKSKHYFIIPNESRIDLSNCTFTFLPAFIKKSVKSINNLNIGDLYLEHERVFRNITIRQRLFGDVELEIKGKINYLQSWTEMMRFYYTAGNLKLNVNLCIMSDRPVLNNFGRSLKRSKDVTELAMPTGEKTSDNDESFLQKKSKWLFTLYFYPFPLLKPFALQPKRNIFMDEKVDHSLASMMKRLGQKNKRLLDTAEASYSSGLKHSLGSFRSDDFSSSRILMDNIKKYSNNKNRLSVGEESHDVFGTPSKLREQLEESGDEMQKVIELNSLVRKIYPIQPSIPELKTQKRNLIYSLYGDRFPIDAVFSPFNDQWIVIDKVKNGTESIFQRNNISKSNFNGRWGKYLTTLERSNIQDSATDLFADFQLSDILNKSLSQKDGNNVSDYESSTIVGSKGHFKELSEENKSFNPRNLNDYKHSDEKVKNTELVGTPGTDSNEEKRTLEKSEELLSVAEAKKQINDTDTANDDGPVLDAEAETQPRETSVTDDDDDDNELYLIEESTHEPDEPDVSYDDDTFIVAKSKKQPHIKGVFEGYDNDSKDIPLENSLTENLNPWNESKNEIQHGRSHRTRQLLQISDNEREEGLEARHIVLDNKENTRLKRYLPHNDWCHIPKITRHGTLECTVWTYKKECNLKCHPGWFQPHVDAHGETLFRCTRKKNEWDPKNMAPCQAEEKNQNNKRGTTHDDVDYDDENEDVDKFLESKPDNVSPEKAEESDNVKSTENWEEDEEYRNSPDPQKTEGNDDDYYEDDEYEDNDEDD